MLARAACTYHVVQERVLARTNLANGLKLTDEFCINTRSSRHLTGHSQHIC